MGGGRRAGGSSTCSAVKLAIDEIGDTAEKEPDGHSASGGISYRERIQFAVLSKQKERDDHTEHTAMERHAALPDHWDLAGIIDEIARLIEDHIAEPSADDDAKGAPH